MHDTVSEPVASVIVLGSIITGYVVKMALDKLLKGDKTSGEMSPHEWEAKIFDVVRKATHDDTAEILRVVRMLHDTANAIERQTSIALDRRSRPRNDE